jgi:hypothetical protein
MMTAAAVMMSWSWSHLLYWPVRQVRPAVSRPHPEHSKPVQVLGHYPEEARGVMRLVAQAVCALLAVQTAAAGSLDSPCHLAHMAPLQ